MQELRIILLVSPLLGLVLRQITGSWDACIVASVTL